MSVLRHLLLVALLGWLSACGVPLEVPAPEGAAGAPPRGDLPDLDRAEARSRPPRSSPPSVRFLAATADGAALALAEGTGVALATAPLADGFVLRDIVPDAPHGRALIFAADLENAYGEVLSVEVEASGLGTPAHVAWIDGDARLGATGGAIVAFEQSYGDAWKRLDAVGASLPRWPAPPPLSLGVNGAGLDALIDDGGGGLALVRLVDDVTAWPPVPLAVGASATAPPSARVVEGEAGSTWLFDGVGAELGVRAPSPDAELVSLGLDGAASIVASSAFGCGARVALVLDDGSLVTLRLDGAGLPHDVARLPPSAGLPADASSLRVLARIAPTRLLLATASGVLVADVSALTPVLDAAFDGSAFRAPVVAWP